MTILSSLTRMWLTKSFKPFAFKDDYDSKLDYFACEDLGLYIHIPFCKNICAFCPYCKVKYEEDLANKYIDALLKEIDMVSAGQRREISSLYFGGGSPALVVNRIGDIISKLQEHFVIKDGIGIELHPDNVNLKTLEKLKVAGVTKLSIGIQSFNDKYQELLGRKTIDQSLLRENLQAVKFETVSMDFIFALPNQSFEDLKGDIDLAFYNGANHIAIYPFIDFAFTKNSIKTMSKNEKRRFLDRITNYCLEKGYSRKSIWTFSNEKAASYSSMTRNNFLGFGCSATSLLKDQFKINTFSVEEYCKRIADGKLPTSLTLRFSLRQRMVYYLFWTLYTTKLDKRDFKKFFGYDLKNFYGFEFWLGEKLGFLIEKDGVYEMTLKGAFYYHYYENFYTLAYIDKMWGILSREAFPKKIVL